jgi:Domain of unknown function (DUF4192)
MSKGEPMTTTENPTLRVTGPAELLGAVPYLLGFHPEESLVIIGLDESKVIVTARLDLADIAGSRVVADTLAAIKRGQATAVVGAVFTETPVPTEPIAADLDKHARGVGLDVVDTLIVTGSRWRSLVCRDTGCCPLDGTRLPTTPTVLDAVATYAGLTALPNRNALAEMFAPLPGRQDLTDQMEHHHHEQLNAVLNAQQDSYDRSVIRALFTAQRAAEAGQLPTDAAVARYGVALQSYSVRDAAWLAVDAGRLTGIALWVNLARRLPNPYDAAPLFIAAWSTYRDGNGALAGIAAELALKSDRGYSAADLLLAALARGLDPRTLPKLRLPAQSKGAAEPDINA